MVVRVHALTLAACLAAAALPLAPALAQGVSKAIAAAVADPGRPAADVKRDPQRHPAEVVAFAGIKPGMKVAELNPGGGYYTRILSKVVGPTGKIYLMTASERRTAAEKDENALAQELGNVTPVWQPRASPLTPEPVDVVWTTDNYHDFYNGLKGDMASFDKAVFDSLKPGGEFLIEDYEAAPGAGASVTQTLHRIEDPIIKQQVEAAGFKLEKQSPVLRNPKDDYSQHSTSTTSDQVVLLFRKPK